MGTGKRALVTRRVDMDDGNIIDFKKKKDSKESAAAGEGPEEKHIFYQVDVLIGKREAERLIALKYMTESGYLDLMGLLNQIQEHNLRKISKVLWTSVGISVAITTLVAVIILGI